jgi:hypothetical protein
MIATKPAEKKRKWFERGENKEILCDEKKTLSSLTAVFGRDDGDIQLQQSKSVGDAVQSNMVRRTVKNIQFLESVTRRSFDNSKDDTGFPA